MYLFSIAILAVSCHAGDLERLKHIQNFQSKDAASKEIAEIGKRMKEEYNSALEGYKTVDSSRVFRARKLNRFIKASGDYQYFLKSSGNDAAAEELYGQIWQANNRLEKLHESLGSLVGAAGLGSLFIGSKNIPKRNLKDKEDEWVLDNMFMFFAGPLIVGAVTYLLWQLL